MGWQRATLADMMGQNVVYRNLQPMDARIPGLETAWQAVGLERYFIPRKTTPEYAQTIWYFLHEAQRLRGIQRPIARVWVVGDNARSDGAVAHHMNAYCPTRGFIGTEVPEQPKRIAIEQNILMVANRWNALLDFTMWLESEGFSCDETTALVIDLDKTSLGARGRNDGMIDAARVYAVERIARDILGPAFDKAAFHALYARLIKSQYHYLTQDNQDYVAYICLMVAANVYPEQRFWAAIEDGTLADIHSFAATCDSLAPSMADGVFEIHHQVYQAMAAGDPTPFKAFRRLEFLETIERMDALPDDAAPEAVLAQEIVLTAEVYDLAAKMATQGALVFGLSDKPDEASLPTPEMAAQGYRAIHETPMKVYGERLF